MTKPRVHTTADGKSYTYHWCSKETGGDCAGRWVQHMPAECILAEEFKKCLETRQAKRTSRTPDTLGSINIKMKLKVAKSLALIVDEDKVDNNNA